MKIKNGSDIFDSIALAPISVLPEYQGKGIGKMLILEAHNMEFAEQLNTQKDLSNNQFC